MKKFTRIKKPTLLLDQQKCLKNIWYMVAKAREHGLHFRPHFKTHQSAAIGEWFREEGVKAITVSSVSMAEYFADHGWEDITIAFPLNLRELDEINRLATKIHLNLLLDSYQAASFLQHELKAEAGVFIEIDTGSKRSGIKASDLPGIEKIVETIIQSSKTRFRGFLTHAGHTYQAKSKTEVLKIHEDSLNPMRSLKNHFAGLNAVISIGDTPACSLAEDFSGADEIRPGNFVFYDLMQADIGACSVEDVAVALACPVVASYPQRSEAVIYGGAIHLSKDFMKLPDGKISFGRIAKLNHLGWEVLPEGNEIVSISQEHGIAKLQAGFFNDFSTGGLLAVIPVHSCLTAQQQKHYHTFENDFKAMME